MAVEFCAAGETTVGQKQGLSAANGACTMLHGPRKQWESRVPGPGSSAF